MKEDSFFLLDQKCIENEMDKENINIDYMIYYDLLPSYTDITYLAEKAYNVSKEMCLYSCKKIIEWKRTNEWVRHKRN